MPKVEFEREGVVVEARAGQTLLEVAEASGVELFRGMWPALHCGTRKGWCRRCKVWVRRGGGGGEATMALACKVAVECELGVQTRAGGPPPTTTAQTGAPAWKNAVSARAAKEPEGEP